ncbi:MAG: histidine--tRNA ligase [Luteitalea sp.]|nr:histidine--tRNA ligase [Luteitalea sp.]
MPATQPARGTRDFLPDEVRRRTHVIGVVREVYERYGFEPLETPAVENLETLLGKYGEEGNQLIFRVLRRGSDLNDVLLKAVIEPLRGGPFGEEGEAKLAEMRRTAARALPDLALRYDLTVPLARVVAEYRGKLPTFFKRYQIQPVWRADRPARGRFREFYQCDVDVLGSRSMVVEAELCAAASDALATLGFRDFVVRLNHRQVLAGILDAAGVESGAHDAALVALDKLDKIGRTGVAGELASRGIDASAGERLLELFAELSTKAAQPAAVQNAATVARMRAFVGAHADGARAIADLEAIVRLVESTAAAGRVHIDASLARGLSYYTGAIMEINVPDLAGSLGGGGRYDNLVGMFLGQEVPACGFSLGLERIIVVMTERGMFPERLTSAPADVMVTIWSDEAMAETLALAHDLRRAGLRVDVYPEAQKLGKQMRYASSRGVPCVAILGDEERARGEVSIKDMRSGGQLGVRRSEAAGQIRRLLSMPDAE